MKFLKCATLKNLEHAYDREIPANSLTFPPHGISKIRNLVTNF